LTLRGTPVPAAHSVKQLHVPPEGLRFLVVLWLEGAEAPQDVRRLTNHQAKIREIEWDVFESQHGTRVELMAPQHVRRQIEHRQTHATLDAPLQLEELEVHVDGCCDRSDWSSNASRDSERAGRGGRVAESVTMRS
jgi:hypothetical protein